MKEIEFRKRLAGAVKNLEVYTDDFAIDTLQANRLMQEILRHYYLTNPAGGCPNQTEHPQAHENKQGNTLPENHNRETDCIQLPKHLVEVFVLYISGYKLHEIAEMLRIPVGTVKSRIYAAEKELEKG